MKWKGRGDLVDCLYKVSYWIFLYFSISFSMSSDVHFYFLSLGLIFIPSSPLCLVFLWRLFIRILSSLHSHHPTPHSIPHPSSLSYSISLYISISISSFLPSHRFIVFPVGDSCDFLHFNSILINSLSRSDFPVSSLRFISLEFPHVQLNN